MRVLVGLAASLIVNLAVLGSLDLSVQHAHPVPPGAVSVLQLAHQQEDFTAFQVPGAALHTQHASMARM